MKETAAKRKKKKRFHTSTRKKKIIPYLYNAEVWVQGFFKSRGRRGDKEWKTGEKKTLIRLIKSVPLVGRIKYHRTTFSVSKLLKEISRIDFIFSGGCYHQ